MSSNGEILRKQLKEKKKPKISSMLAQQRDEAAVGGSLDGNKRKREKQIDIVFANAERKKAKKKTVREKGFEVVDFEDNNASLVKGNKNELSKTKRVKRKKKSVSILSEASTGEGDDVMSVDNVVSGGKKKKLLKKKKMQRKKKNGLAISEGKDDTIVSEKDGVKPQKHVKKKNTDQSKENGNNFVEKRQQTDQNVVYNISAVDEDCSKGMKRWIKEYHDSRPGLKVLEQRIDDFIIAHEARIEEDKKQKKVLAEEEGWTVVEHHKGRKKTTDTETGTTVGSVAQAAVEDKMAKKKHKGVGLDFYRFQKKEARINEILALQTKFEQDKKRIEQLRSARKFRPY